MVADEAAVLLILKQIETGELTVTPDQDPQEQIKGDILFRVSNGWTIEVSNWSGEFAGIVEVITSEGQVLDTNFLEHNMPRVDDYFPDPDVASRVWGMKPVETGFIYAADAEPRRLEGAKAGDVIANPDSGPPWMILYPTLNDVLVPQWPGKLWLARVLERLEPQDHRGTYVRCISVKLDRQMETHNLFGACGQAVETVLTYAANLTRAQAVHLSANRHTESKALQSAGWRRWQEQVTQKPTTMREDMSGVVRAANNLRSPVGYGLSLAHRGVWDAAQAIDSDAAFQEDEDDIWLVEPWAGAGSAMMDTVWALGAPELFDVEEREKLLQAWTARQQP